jgi:hypothetical protein
MSVSYILRIMLVGAAAIVWCGAVDAAEPGAAVRVAVVDTAGLKKFTSVLEAFCGQDKRIVQIDRTTVLAMVAEKRLKAVLGEGNWRQAGKMLNAELIVLVGKGEKQAFARVVATHLGVVLAEHRFDAAAKRLDVQGQHVYNLLVRDLLKVRLKPENVLLLSAAALTAEAYSPKLVGVERKLTLGLLHRLANHKRIVLLERRRLDTVAWEQSISPASRLAPAAKLATAQAVLIASIARKNGKISLEGRLQPAGRKAVAINVSAPADQGELLVGKTIAAILKAADLAASAPLSLKAEADFHARQAKTLVYHGLVSGKPLAKYPPGAFVRRSGRRYYLGGPVLVRFMDVDRRIGLKHRGRPPGEAGWFLGFWGWGFFNVWAMLVM